MVQSRSDKITQSAVNYLDTTLPAPFYVNDFSTEQYLELLKHLFEVYSESTVLANILAVEKGFRVFFLKSNQEIEVKLNAFSIKISRIFEKNRTNLVLDKALFTLNQKLRQLNENIKEFEIYSYLHQFPQEKAHELFESFNKLELSNDAKRTYIREELDTVFSLHQRDIILFLSKQIYIRNFVPPTRKPTSIEQRFNGCDQDQLVTIYENGFPSDFCDTLLEMIPELEDSSLNFSHLDNNSFHLKLPDAFRSILDIAMLPYTEHLDEETCLGLNGYILRLNFDIILAKLAEILLQKVLKRDKQADLFLKYYNGETVLNKKGQKIKKSSITDANNNMWNYSAIFSILTQYTQTQKNLQTHKTALNEKEDLYIKLANELKSIQEQHKIEVKKLDKLREQTVHKRSECTSLQFRSENSSDKELKSEFRHCSAEVRKKEKEYDTLNEFVNILNLKLENIKTETHNRKQHYIKEKETIKRIELNFEELKKNYNNIKTTLAKAITGR